jgi:hypothetical protein
MKSLPGERMNLQEKLEQMAMTSLERRLLEHWLAAGAARTNANEAAENQEADDAAAPETPPATGTDGA